MDNTLASDTTNVEEVVVPTTTETVPETKEEPTQTPVEGSEPEKEPKVVRELKEQRRKRQEAERLANEAREEASKQKADAAYYRGLAEGKGYKPASETTDEPVAPDIQNFETTQDFDKAHEKYLQDIVSYRVKQEISTREKESRKQREDEERKREIGDVEKNFAIKMSEAIDDDPELGTMRDTVGTMIDYNFGVAIKQSENSPELIRYLYNNTAEISRLQAIRNPIVQARELMKIEVKLNASQPTPTKTVTQAPKPIETVNASKGTIITVDEDKMPIEDWMEKERQRRIDSRTRK